METTTLPGLEIDDANKGYLKETARWAKFLAIVGFVMCGLLIIFGLFFSSMMANMSGGFSGMGDGPAPPSGIATMLGIVYVLLAVLYFFPCLYLYRFATSMLAALETNQQHSLTHSFENLKSCFKFVGILMIVILCFYVLGIIAFAIGMSMR